MTRPLLPVCRPYVDADSALWAHKSTNISNLGEL